MPAKTVVFTGTKKFDGGTFRSLTGGEYTQMSGRAGRRGLDDRGIVILMLDVQIEPPVAKSLVKGAPDALISEFRLGYNMIINILRLEAGKPEQMIKHSYSQFLAERSIPQLKATLLQLKKEVDDIEIQNEEQLKSYMMLLKQIVQLQDDAAQVTNHPKYALPFLQPGRLVRVLVGSDELQSKAEDPLEMFQTKRVWAAVVNFQSSKAMESQEEVDTEEVETNKQLLLKRKFTVDILVNVHKSSLQHGQQVILEDLNSGVPAIVGVTLDKIIGFTAVRVHLDKDLKSLENRKQGMRCITESLKRLKEKMGGVPGLDAMEEMGVKSNRLKRSLRKSEALQVLLGKSSVHQQQNLTTQLTHLVEQWPDFGCEGIKVQRAHQPTSQCQG
eukprot:TRINITY_DN13850_c0_g1_i10.p1 TRINITY_DN13850_c0_g1~~TRINITY_DN13850_c0_g1_i10.p1  ORF type:complete len:419 (+),score=78.97 TRINITY_DN13850_c0_g1_i10:100-1257(+)